MTHIEDILNKDAVAQAKYIKSREVSPVDLLEVAINRVKEINPKINAVITEMYDQAFESAKNIDYSLPFAGVPFLLKDFLAEYAGVRFTAASEFLGDFVSSEDSELVKRFKSAGFVIIGKTNTPEFAIGAVVEPKRFGPTLNPWDTNLTTGGSSGGAGAAVASRMVSIAHGNDAGGSIRIPASCCGVFGLKPTRGRNSLAPKFGDLFSGLVSEHVLTRSVRDSAAVLDITSGYVQGDPYYIEGSPKSFLGFDPKETKTLKIAFSKKDLITGSVDSDMREALEKTISLCEDLGHEVTEEYPLYQAEEAWLSFTKALSCGLAWSVDGWAKVLKKKPEEKFFEPLVWDLYQKGKAISASEYLECIEVLQLASRNIAGFYEKYDVLMTTTLGSKPITKGSLEYSSGDPFELRKRQLEFSPFTYIANFTGLPAMSVPLIWDTNNIPIGIHFMGRFGEERLLLTLASQLEGVAPWIDKTPSVN